MSIWTPTANGDCWMKGSWRISRSRAPQSDCLSAGLWQTATVDRQNPSGFWLDLLRLLPTMEVQQISRNTRTIGTPRQLVTTLMRWVRSGTSDEMLAGLYQWLVTADNHLREIRDHAWRALRYTNDAKLESALARQLFPSPPARQGKATRNTRRVPIPTISPVTD